MPTTRQLTLADLAEYRALRLEALEQTPEAFGSTLAREQAFTDADFAARLTGGVTIGAFRDNTLGGIASFYAEPGEKDRHKGRLVGMYVRPDLRGTGASRALVEAVLAHAVNHVEQVHLDVVSTNRAARRLYETCGFTAYGTEPRSLKQAGRYFDSVMMVRFLGTGGAEAGV